MCEKEGTDARSNSFLAVLGLFYFIFFGQRTEGKLDMPYLFLYLQTSYKAMNFLRESIITFCRRSDV